MPMDPYCLSDDELTELLRDAPWHRLAVIGDSMAAGVGDQVPGYPSGGSMATLARVLGRVHPDFAYLNLGERDRYAAEVRSYQLPRALVFRPDLAVVLAGGNDMLRRRFEPRAMAAEIDAMVGALRARGSDVVTYGLIDITRSGIVASDFAAALSERLALYARAIGEIAQRHGTVHIVLTEHPAAAEPEMYSADKLRLSARGHAVVAAETVHALHGMERIRRIA